MKKEALKLADELLESPFGWVDDIGTFVTASDYQELHEKLREGMIPLYISPQTKPTITKLDGKVVAVTMTDEEHRVHEVLWEAPKRLSDEDIDAIGDEVSSLIDTYAGRREFARAIEERHGIK